MKELIILLLLLFVYSLLYNNTIIQTLTTDSAELTNIRNSLSTNMFLSDSSNMRRGPYGRSDDDPQRSYSVYDTLSSITSLYLQKGVFSTGTGVDGQEFNLSRIDDYLTNLSYSITDTLTMWNYYTTYIPTDHSTNAQSRQMELSSLLNHATTLFDIMYYYYDNANPNHDHPNLLKLKSIIETCTNLISYIKVKYDALCNQGVQYYWGNPKGNESDFIDENGHYVYLPRFYMIQDRLLMLSALGYGSLILRKNAQIQQLLNPTDPANQGVINQMNYNLGLINT